MENIFNYSILGETWWKMLLFAAKSLKWSNCEKHLASQEMQMVPFCMAQPLGAIRGGWVMCSNTQRCRGREMRLRSVRSNPNLIVCKKLDEHRVRQFIMQWQRFQAGGGALLLWKCPVMNRATPVFVDGERWAVQMSFSEKMLPNECRS